MAQKLNERFTDKFDLMLWCSMPAMILLTLIAAGLSSMVDIGATRMFIVPMKFVVIFCLWQILKCTRFKSISGILLILLHNIMTSVISNVAIRGLMPDLVKLDEPLE